MTDITHKPIHDAQLPLDEAWIAWIKRLYEGDPGPINLLFESHERMRAMLALSGSGAPRTPENDRP